MIESRIVIWFWFEELWFDFDLIWNF